MLSSFRPSARLAPLLALFLAACGGRGASDALLRIRPPSPHERYAESLRDAGLAGTALGRDWLAAASRALAEPLPAALPYRETGYFSASEASAVALRVRPRRGERLTVQVEPAPGTVPFALFVDLFEVRAADSAGQAGAPSTPPPSPSTPPRRVASADSGRSVLEYDVDEDGVAYVVRVQPELLRGGRYTLTIAAGPSLAFPVSGKGRAAVQSFFGVGRDAGRRRHEGVDIFAARGTPVLAASDGIVANAGTTPLGGKVVWVRDLGRRQSLYYAHLDSQIVRPGQRVRVGDTLGLVGNSGNARTTPPHLHFGVYARGRGAVDPFPYIDPRREELPRLTADTGALGAVRRVAARRGAPLRLAAGVTAALRLTLPEETVLRVDGAAGGFYRVRLPDGTTGYVAAAQTERADRGATLAASRLVPRSPPPPAGGSRTAAASAVALRERPDPTAAVVDSVGARAPLEVLGRYGGYVLVRTGENREGWVAGTR